MDNSVHLSPVGPSGSESNPLRSLGWNLVTPLNTPALSKEETELFWQLVSGQDYEFSDFERGNREAWLTRFKDMRHLHLDIGGDGYCVLINAWCCDTPDLHFCIWNPERPFRDILAAGVEILNFVFKQMNAARVTGFIPENNPNAKKFATMLGFKFEGELRQAFLYHGKRLNVSIFGILRQEWLQRQERLNGRQ